MMIQMSVDSVNMNLEIIVIHVTVVLPTLIMKKKERVIGLVIQDMLREMGNVKATLKPVVLGNISLETLAIAVPPSHQVQVIQIMEHVIGAVTVDITEMGIRVSAILRTVALDNTQMEVPANRVSLDHQIVIIPLQDHVAGLVMPIITLQEASVFPTHKTVASVSILLEISV